MIFCIFIKTLVLWKRNVSTAAASSGAAQIRNSVPTSAETIITTVLTATQTTMSEMFMVCCEKTGESLPTFTMKEKERFTGMPFSPSAITLIFLLM